MVGKIAPFPSVRGEDVTPFLSEKAGQIVRGFLVALFLALCVFGLAKIEGIVRKLDAVSKNVSAERATDELARTRYETLLRDLHEVKVKIDYQNALYQDDVRRGLVHERKESR